MTKSNEMEAVDPSSKATELKEELQRIVRAIVEADDSATIEIFDRGLKTLSALKELKLKRSTLQRLDSVLIPEHFVCPLSSELMKDPVILATGQVRLADFIFRVLHLYLSIGVLILLRNLEFFLLDSCGEELENFFFFFLLLVVIRSEGQVLRYLDK